MIVALPGLFSYLFYRGIHYFSYFAKNIDFGYSLEPPPRSDSSDTLHMLCSIAQEF